MARNAMSSRHAPREAGRRHHHTATIASTHTITSGALKRSDAFTNETTRALFYLLI